MNVMVVHVGFVFNTGARQVCELGLFYWSRCWEDRDGRGRFQGTWVEVYKGEKWKFCKEVRYIKESVITQVERQRDLQKWHINY